MMPAPAAKYATKRNPARPTLGPVIRQIDKIITGQDLMPWQAEVTDVVWELDPEHPGEFWYKEGDIIVPRQAGKSRLLEVFHRACAIMFKDWTGYMTAQNGKKAGERWAKLIEHLHLSTGTRAQTWDIKRGKGHESATFLPQNSVIRPFPPTDDSLHGDTNNFVSIDEEWAFSLEDGILIETAAKPGFVVPLMTMLIRASTVGTANSTYMNRNMELGRLATKDPNSHRFYFEWSANEAAAEKDPYSDAALAFHPAIGYTQNARRLRDLGRDMPVSEWRRSFLNLYTATGETVINLATFDALRWNYDPNTAPERRYRPASPADMVLAFDAALDASSTTIYAAWLDETSGSYPCVAQVATAPGTEWVPSTVERLSHDGYRAILADDSGPNRTITQALAAAGVNVSQLSYKEYATACQSLLDRVRTGELEHDGAPALVKAIEVAAISEQRSSHTFDPKKSAGPIDALRAMAIAQDGAARLLSAPLFTFA